VGRGFSENNEVAKRGLNYNYYKNRWISETQLGYMIKTIRILKFKGCEVILIHGPLPDKWDFTYHKRIASVVKRVASDENVMFYDCSSALKLSAEKHFYDSHHLNQDGVNRFNNYLIKHILKAHTGSNE